MVGPDWRVFVTCMWHFSWGVGYMVLPGIAYLIRDWRVLQAVFTIPDVVLFVLWLL